MSLRMIVHVCERVPLAEVTVNDFVFDDQSLYPFKAGEIFAPEDRPQVRNIFVRSIPGLTVISIVPFSTSITVLSDEILLLLVS